VEEEVHTLQQVQSVPTTRSVQKEVTVQEPQCQVNLAQTTHTILTSWDEW